MTTTKRYQAREESGATEIVEADSIQDAINQAEEWVADGSYDERVMVRFSVYEIDEDDEQVEDGESYTGEVEAGPQPEAPECTDGAEHDWQSPYEVLGGLRENPGVWSTGGTSFVHKYVCATCGTYKTERSTGAQRNPGEMAETIEYAPANDRSLAWVAEQGDNGGAR